MEVGTWDSSQDKWEETQKEAGGLPCSGTDMRSCYHVEVTCTGPQEGLYIYEWVERYTLGAKLVVPKANHKEVRAEGWGGILETSS